MIDGVVKMAVQVRKTLFSGTLNFNLKKKAGKGASLENRFICFRDTDREQNRWKMKAMEMWSYLE